MNNWEFNNIQPNNNYFFTNQNEILSNNGQTNYFNNFKNNIEYNQNYSFENNNAYNPCNDREPHMNNII